MIVRVEPGWVIGEDAGGAERRVPLRDLAMVEMVQGEGESWIVTVYLRGEETGVAWLLPGCDEASQLVDDIAQAHDAARAPMTGLELLRMWVLEDLDQLLSGGISLHQFRAG